MTWQTNLLTFRWANVVSELSGYLSAVALLLATAATTHGVASRYFFGHPTVWQTEVSIYLLMFVTFVGGAYGLKNHAHVGVDLLITSAPRRVQLLMRLLAAILSLVVVLVIFWTSTQMWWEATQKGWTSSTAFRAPLSIVYAILPLGMLLVACQYLAFIIEGLLAFLGKSDAEDVALLKIVNPELTAAEDLGGAPPDPVGDRRKGGD